MASTTILDNSKRIHSCYKLPQIFQYRLYQFEQIDT